MEEIQEKKGVNIVTIKSLSPLYKVGESASFIELAACEEHGFDIVVQKNLYEVGDKAIFCQPDFNLPLMSDTPTKAQKLFEDFTCPQGDSKKSKLGKNGRIRAIKFNFNKEPDGLDPVYSMGVMLPLKMVCVAMGIQQEELDAIDLDNLLQIIKYEEPETAYSGLTKGDLPTGMYSTDETNIFNNLRNLEWILPGVLIGSLKVDGSSITVFFKSETDYGICSRNQEKKLDLKVVMGFKDEVGNSVRKHYDQPSGVRGWLNEATSEFLTEIPDTYVPILQEVEDTFVKIGLPVLEKLRAYCLANNRQLALRGELCGQGLKGSGNKNNPHSVLKQQILFYGVDDYSSGVTVKCGSDFFYQLCTELMIETCPVVFRQVFNTLDELKEVCEEYFKTNMIEGIVVRSEDSRFSAKYLNSEYDSRK